ncbi:MAG TPA: protein kinase [Gemmataceae bacterium]|nr:protein kinase [Gemmataceae bacterium]
MSDVPNPAEAETVPPPWPPAPVTPDAAATAPPPEGSAPQVEVMPTVPGYEILEELGHGGMGVVYKARQLSLNRFVALKMILAGPYAGADHLARFRTEAEAVASLQHPGIVQIYEIGNHDGRSFLALEYISGGTLARKCTEGPLPAAEAARLVEALARAAQYAHGHGIVHRDLKPGNVLLTEDGQPKIADFGLAKRLEITKGTTPHSTSLTQSGAILGTPAYMAPEQAGVRRGAIGPAADVYALGAILYELLTGGPPFRGESQVDVIMQVVADDPVPPRRVEPSCPPDLEAVCLKCLQKAPAARYASAGALADDLRRFLAGEPTQARPMTRGQGLRRWMRRRRWPLIGAVAAACLLAALAWSLTLNVLPLFSRHNPSSAVSQPGVEPAPLPEDLDLAPRSAAAFVSVDVGGLLRRQDIQSFNAFLGREKLQSVLESVSAVGAPLGAGPEDLERVTFVKDWAAQAGQPYGYTIVQTAKPFPAAAMQEHLKSRGLTPRRFQDETYFSGGMHDQENISIRGDRTFVIGASEQSLRTWIAHRPAAGSDGPLRPALEAAAQGHQLVVAAALTPKSGQDFIAELRPVLGVRAPPAGVKRPDFGPMAEVQVILLTADLSSRADGAATDGLEAALRLDYGSAADEAKRLGMLVDVRDFLAAQMQHYAAGEEEGMPPAIADQLAAALRSARIEQHDGRGRITLTMGWEPAALAAALKDEGDRVRSLNNLKQLAIAMHDYAEQHDARLPQAVITEKDKKPLLSWRVALLPNIGQGDLYRQFDLNEPWDGPHNTKLLDKMPAVFAPPLQPPGWKPNTTFYHVFVGEQTLFPPGRQLRMPADIPDGTSNTLMIVEAGEAVQWTKPQDLPYDPNGPLPMLGGIFRDGFQAAFADGRSGRFLPKNLPPATLRALITPAGGEVVELP